MHFGSLLLDRKLAPNVADFLDLLLIDVNRVVNRFQTVLKLLNKCEDEGVEEDVAANLLKTEEINVRDKVGTGDRKLAALPDGVLHDSPPVVPR